MIPAAYSAEVKIDRNRARQLLEPEWIATVSAGETGMFVIAQHGHRYRLLTGPAQLADGERALKIPRAARQDSSLLASARLVWIGNLAPSPATTVSASLESTFSFVLADGEAGTPGMRLPQLGAVHAVLGYWTTGATQAGTVVMPTGTGKTETMVALFASVRPERLLVVVPSDALRDQLAAKFESFGVLQEAQVIAPSALRPVVVASPINSSLQMRRAHLPMHAMFSSQHQQRSSHPPPTQVPRCFQHAPISSSMRHITLRQQHGGVFVTHLERSLCFSLPLPHTARTGGKLVAA